MNVFKESPRDARSTTTAGIRARLTRTLSMALAVAITAILLPAAISLAKTGSFGAIPVVEAITGTSSSSGQDSGATTTQPHQSAPAAQQPAQQSDDPAALADANLPTLKDDKAVAARLSNGNSDRQRSRNRDNSSADDNGGTRHDPTGDAPAVDTTGSTDDGTTDQGSGDAAGTPADDTSQPTDTSAGQDDNPSSGDTSADDHDHGKGNDNSGKKDTPKPPASPAPVATIPPDTPPATTPDTSTDTTTADTTPASDVPADASAAPADTRRQFTLDPTESASLIVDVPEGADHITLWAQAAGVECAPRVAVTVDGEPSDDFTLAGTDWQSHVITPVPDAGVHVVRVLSLGTDPQVGCADATQDVVTIAEPRVGTDGDNPPASATTLTATDTSAITDATSATDSTATTTTDDGTADQGTGDAAATTPSDTSTTTTDNGTADQGTGDAAATTPSDSSTGTADDGTADQGSGDVTGDTSATTTDSRRQYSLYTRESVTLVADEATDGGKLTMWLRTSSEQCQLRVIVSVDDRIQKIVGVNHADWQSETIDYQADGSTHRIAIGVLRPKGGNCTGTETLTIVEPTAGEQGAATPALPVTPLPADTATDPATGTPTDTTTPTDTIAPTTSKGGSQAGVLWSGAPEAGLSAWNTEHTVSSSRISVATMAGRMAYRMEVDNGDNANGFGERTELGQDGNSAKEFHNGDDVWQGYSVYMPGGFPTDANWTALTQWKDINPDLGSPSWGTYVEHGQIGVGGVLAGGDLGLFSRPAATDVWHNFVIHMKLGTSASTGSIDVYYSTGQNTPTLVYSGKRQTYRTAAKMVPRMGYYRDKSLAVDAAVYHAGYAIGTSFDAVNPVK